MMNVIEIINNSEKEKLDFLFDLWYKIEDKQEKDKLQAVIVIVKEFYQNKRLIFQAMECNKKLQHKPNYDEM